MLGIGLLGNTILGGSLQAQEKGVITLLTDDKKEAVENGSVSLRCLEGPNEGRRKILDSDKSGNVTNPYNAKVAIAISHVNFHKVFDTLNAGESKTYYLVSKSVVLADFEVTAEKDKPKDPGIVFNSSNQGEKEKRPLELDYQAGLALNLYLPSTDFGDAIQGPGIGLKGELIFNPKYRLMVGFVYSALTYDFGKEDSIGIAASDQVGFPQIDPDAGVLQRIETKNTQIDIPIEVRYFVPVGKQTRAFVSAGASGYLFLNQEFNYSYLVTSNGNSVTENETEKADGSFYFGSANTGLGFEWDLGELLTFQAGVFYKYGLSTFGVEEREWNHFGFRTTVLFAKKRW